MAQNFMHPWRTGSSECAKGRESKLVTLNVKRDREGGESGGTFVKRVRVC